MSISTHVLDATTGRPAAGLELVLSRQDGGRWHELARCRTDADGRVSDLASGAGPGTGADPGPDPDAGTGVYRIVFLSEAYLRAQSPAAETFYPEISVIFRITEPGARHHVPLLLSPFAFSTYRGS
jgi:5-hydroxyisourate hydrolase